MSFQLQRKGAFKWDILEQVEHAENVIEFVIVGRLVADDDAWYIERPVWQDQGHYFERIPRPYVTSKAALMSVTRFDAKAS